MTTQAYADVDDLGLFEPEDTRRPVGFVSVCQFCGAKTEPLMIDDAGDSWSTPVLFGLMAVKRHQESGECPGPPPDAPGVHLRPAGPNYGPGTHPDPTRP